MRYHSSPYHVGHSSLSEIYIYIYDVSGVVSIPNFKRRNITVVLEVTWPGLESNPGQFNNLVNTVTAGFLWHFSSLNIFQCKVEAEMG